MKHFKTLKALENYAKRHDLTIEKVHDYSAEETEYIFDGICYAGSANIYIAHNCGYATAYYLN